MLGRNPPERVEDFTGSAAGSAHLDEHLPVLLQFLLEQRQKLLLELHELLEGFEGLRGRHRRPVMPAHRQVPVPGHPPGNRLQQGSDLPVFLRQLVKQQCALSASEFPEGSRLHTKVLIIVMQHFF